MLDQMDTTENALAGAGDVYRRKWGIYIQTKACASKHPTTQSPYVPYCLSSVKDNNEEFESFMKIVISIELWSMRERLHDFKQENKLFFHGQFRY